METRTNKAGFKESVTHRECTNCGDMFKRTTTDTMKICSKCNTARVISMDPRYKMRNRAQQRAKVSGTHFDLAASDIIIPELCPVFGVPIKACIGQGPGGHKYSPSLDKIDPSKGYTKENTRVISHLANQMKSHATVAELIQFAKWVLENHTLEEN